MKPIVWANTVEHTGGTLLCNTFLSNFINPIWLGDSRLMQRGNVKGLDDYELAEIKDKTISRLNENEQNSDAILFSSHHSNIYSPCMTSVIMGESPPMPMITSLRDPLLIINTWVWWMFAFYGIELKQMKRWERQMRTNHVMGVVMNISSLFRYKDVYTYTIGCDGDFDLVNRMDQTESLYKRLGVEFTDSSKKLFEEWKPINETNKGHDLNAKNGKEIFEDYKKRILSNDMDFLMQNYDVEMYMLRSNKLLKNKLYAIGYRNLAWW